MFFFSSRRRHTRSLRDWSSDVCSSDLWWFGGDGLCALPSANGGASAGGDVLVQVWTGELWRESRRVRSSASSPMRSEERRVGKGGGSRGSARRAELKYARWYQCLRTRS